MIAAASVHLREVLGQWDLTPDRVRRISARSNTHWRIQRGTDAFVLRRYRPGQTAASIRYELEVLGHLHARGWPVAMPIDGVRWHRGRAFVLFPSLPGRARARGTRETDQHRRERGRILARLHRDLDSLTRHGQRDGWQRADEVVLAEEQWAARLAAAARSPTWPPALVRAVAAHWRATHERLVAWDARGFPVTVVHGDLISQNLRFQHGWLCGLLDLDMTHLDLRAADVACARRSGADGTGDEVVGGYLEVGVLAAAELARLADLWRATVLRYAAQLLDGTATGGPPAAELGWCVRQLDKTRPFHAQRPRR
jgi:Ser/Thr protein kinase RdoA (MazF antagonist)